MSGILYIVATPIGNLKDITFRAIETLKEADLILCEDTRVTRKLLDHYDIKINTMTYNQHSFDRKKDEILNLLLQGKNIALVTDAGTPGISDPGNELIEFILEGDIKIIPIPGASSLTAALSASGIKSNEFLFLGFLPKKGKAKIWEKIKVANTTTVFFESPHRIIKSLEEIKANFGDIDIFICRELTKMYETIYRGKISDVLTKLGPNIKGELVCILEL
jgi:16S rRNA (cytidine1402-2'-O)-methyltransferase